MRLYDDCYVPSGSKNPEDYVRAAAAHLKVERSHCALVLAYKALELEPGHSGAADLRARAASHFGIDCFWQAQARVAGLSAQEVRTLERQGLVVTEPTYM